MSADSSLTMRAYAQLRDELITCQVAPGERLVITDICARLGVSLGAVREALARLTSDGLVVAEPNRGFRATPISSRELRDLTEARVEIEISCLRRSLAQGDLDWEARLVAAYHSLSRLHDRSLADASQTGAVAKAHLDFHRVLVEGCDNQWLLRLRELLYAQSERYRFLVRSAWIQERDFNGEHHALMDAALARDVELAATLLAEHLTSATRILLQTPEITLDVVAEPTA